MKAQEENAQKDENPRKCKTLTKRHKGTQTEGRPSTTWKHQGNKTQLKLNKVMTKQKKIKDSD